MNYNNASQGLTHFIAAAIVLAVIGMYVMGSNPPELLIGAFGLVVNQYLRTQTENNVHAQTERVLGAQVIAEPPSQAR
jgi:hypothetical protein